MKPSLEYTILLKIVIMLWNQDDVRALMRKYRFPLLFKNRIKEWQKIEDKVIEKVLSLPQLGLLTEKLIGFIKPIGIQILKWMEYHCTGLYLYINLPENFVGLQTVYWIREKQLKC